MASAKELFEAISAEDVGWTRTVLTKGVAATSVRNGTPALCLAAELGCLQIVTLLLDKGAKTQCSDTSGQTPLHKAASAEAPEVAQALVRVGAVLDARDQDGETPLHTAVSYDSLETFRLLLQAGAKVDVLSSQESGSQSPLHVAVDGSPEMCKALLANGADPNLVDAQGDTPLHRAAAYGQAAIVPLLVKAGGDPERRNLQGQSCVDLAAGSAGMIALLKGDDVDPASVEAEVAGAATAAVTPAPAPAPAPAPVNNKKSSKKSKAKRQKVRGQRKLPTPGKKTRSNSTSSGTSGQLKRRGSTASVTSTTSTTSTSSTRRRLPKTPKGKKSAAKKKEPLQKKVAPPPQDPLSQAAAEADAAAAAEAKAKAEAADATPRKPPRRQQRTPSQEADVGGVEASPPQQQASSAPEAIPLSSATGSGSTSEDTPLLGSGKAKKGCCTIL
eukprot:m.489168 g.489168  ORF g.489168 m.489168 type:complete len:444 (+) comp26460_c0_seq1:105-1436(+)